MTTPGYRRVQLAAAGTVFVVTLTGLPVSPAIWHPSGASPAAAGTTRAAVEMVTLAVDGMT